MRRITLSALALVGTLGLADIARAGCCNDFWSCLGAVASAGLSCQVESLIDTVKAMKTMVETVTNDLRTKVGDIISQTQRAVADASNDMKQLREQSLSSLQQAADAAHAIVNPVKNVALAPVTVARPGAAAPAVAPGSVVARPGVTIATMPGARPADPAAVKDALSRGEAYIQDLRGKVASPANEVANAERAALEAAARHLRTAQQISLDVALAPLDLLRNSLLDLLSHPERIFDPSAQIEADIQRITAEVPALLNRIANEVSQEAMADLDRAKESAQQLQDSAASAQNVLEQMKKLSSSGAQSDLDALDRTLPRRNPSIALHAMLVPGIAGNRQILATAFARTDPGKLPLVIQHRAALNDLASKWQSIKTRIKSPAPIEAGSAERVDHELGQMFAGKGRGDIDRKKQELLEEAKRRFSNDPKTLEKVRQYIETHAKG